MRAKVQCNRAACFGWYLVSGGRWWWWVGGTLELREEEAEAGRQDTPLQVLLIDGYTENYGGMLPQGSVKNAKG